jgi:PTS system nitrogen regulatory IIA component
MDLQELASYLGRDARELGKLANRGQLPGRKIGGEWRFTTVEIHRWVEHEMHDWSEQELRGIDRACPIAGFAPLVAELIPVECIDLNFQARTKDSAIRDLIKLADRSNRLWNVDAIREAVENREASRSTAWPEGFATPHPHRRLPQVQSESVIAFARSPGGISFGAERGVLTDLFFLICCTDDAEHLRVLSRLSRMLRGTGLVDQLRAAETAAEARQLIATAELGLSNN